MIINKRFLKKYSLLPLNYDTSEVENFIDIAERKWIIPVLGNTLYDDIQEELETTSGNPTEETSELLVNAVWPYEATAVCLEFLPFSYLKISEVGIVKGWPSSNDNKHSTTADLKDITYLQSQLRANLEERKKYCISWLEEHQEHYPTWQPSAEACGCYLKRNPCCEESALNPPEPHMPFYPAGNNPTI